MKSHADEVVPVTSSFPSLASKLISSPTAKDAVPRMITEVPAVKLTCLSSSDHELLENELLAVM